MHSLSNYKKLFNHNFHVFFNVCLFEIYKYIDTIKCIWFVITGKGTSGEYHLKTYVSIIKGKPLKELQMSLFVIKLCNKLNISEDTTVNIVAWFMPIKYLRYSKNPAFIEMFEMFSNIKTPKDALAMYSAVSGFQPSTISYRLGEELFNKLNEVDFTEANKLLN